MQRVTGLLVAVAALAPAHAYKAQLPGRPASPPLKPAARPSRHAMLLPQELEPRSSGSALDPSAYEKEATGSLLGATLLVAGTTVGAGILALPAVELQAGFVPSSTALLGAWVYMAASGLLIAEVNVNTLCALDRNAVSISSMAEETIGPVGATLSSLAYAFIHYTLLVAYVLQGGTLVTELLAPIATVPPGLGPPAYAAALGGALFASKPALIEKLNNLLVFGVVGSFVALVTLGAGAVDTSLLAHADVPAVVPALPVMALSLVYHNVVPTISNRLGCRLPRIRTAIVLGTLLPTAMFIAWSAVILGAVPYDAAAFAPPGTTFDPLTALRASGDAFGSTVRIFSLLAVTTSFVGFCYGLTDFFADLIGYDTPSAADTDAREADAEAAQRPASQRAVLYSLTLLPPVAFAAWDPSIFFAALDNAGTYGILTLFGIIPAWMAWVQRYESELPSVTPDALPGGKATLAAMGLIASGIVGVETWERLVVLPGLA